MRYADPRRVVLATPVGAANAVADLRREVDVVCLNETEGPLAVADAYADSALSTEHLTGDPATGTAVAQPRGRGRDEMVLIAAGRARLPGRLQIPADAIGVVVFAHDVDGNRHSAADRFLAATLNRAGLGTLQVDLITQAEEFFRANVVHVPLLARRVGTVTDWLARRLGAGELPIGYLGVGAGAAAALMAADEPGRKVGAIVSRSGLPHLAGPALASVGTATLLIVGGRDRPTLELNRRARRLLRCEHRLAVVPGATRGFDEPGALRAAADLACEWFAHHLVAEPARAR